MNSDEKEPCDDTPAKDDGIKTEDWPVNSAPGTGPALHDQLMRQHEQGQKQRPTHISTENEQRDRGKK